MQYDEPLIPARLIRRYKRFLADVIMPDGSEITVHTPNTGSMLGCSTPGSTVWLRDSHNPKRKYRYSWEITEDENGVLIGVNTGLQNLLAKEALEAELIPELDGYGAVRQEVKYGSENSRIDLLLQEHPQKPSAWVELKNVTTCDSDGFGYFPDAVSTRASKHLRELIAQVEQGERGVLLFCVQRGDVQRVRPADEIDSTYGKTIRQAAQAGVELLACRADVSPQGIALTTPIPVILP